jgi:hypothetical protein
MASLSILDVLRRTVLTSLDLLEADARQLVAKVTQQTKDRLGATALTAGQRGKPLPELHSIDVNRDTTQNDGESGNIDPGRSEPMASSSTPGCGSQLRHC